MSWKYELFEEHCSSELDDDYIMYGIKVIENKEIIKVVHFVSKDYEKITTFIRCLNDGGLNPIHLPDMLHDNMEIYHIHSLK